MAAPRRRLELVPRSGDPRVCALDEVVRVPVRSPIADDLKRGLAAAASLHRIATDLEAVPVRPTATTTEAGVYRYWRHEPIDIRVSRRTNRIASSFLHELGHFFDHQIEYDLDRRAFASAVHPAFAAWRAAVIQLARIRLVGAGAAGRTFHSLRELWARSYAQTVLLHSNDPALQTHLEELQRNGDVYVWPQDVFEPVGREVERVFHRLGLAA